jgi:hypothetical protein
MPLHDVLRQGTHVFAGSLNSHRILLYGLVSAIAVSAVIINALKNYSNFYSVTIYLSKSNRSVLVRVLSICVISSNELHSRFWLILAFFLPCYVDTLYNESFLAICDPMKSRYSSQLRPCRGFHPYSTFSPVSDCMTVYGSLSQNLSWHSPSSVTNLTFRSPLCLGSCCSSNHFIGSQEIVSNGCVLLLHPWARQDQTQSS